MISNVCLQTARFTRSFQDARKSSPRSSKAARPGASILKDAASLCITFGLEVVRIGKYLSFMLAGLLFVKLQAPSALKAAHSLDPFAR